ncbi:MAG: potassium transporter Kup [Legionellales bacterium RIFCSPHIGHO2_12_FULL_37_14]|nr:MAG: potassium transporter Kup [Legionellales bacterium RIFCSPHIGHO2_12_FULL_37_14]
MRNKFSYSLSLAALGVVFGDIGTSPLYAFRETMGRVAPDMVNILGALSLIFWSLIIVISVKYLTIVFRADNKGEGGGLALLALLKQKHAKHENILYVAAIFGAGLLLGDGMLTPAISVTSAIEGLKIISPVFDDLVLPISCSIIIILFMLQSHGTSKIGGLFGPMILIWFITIGLLGINAIIESPFVLAALNPYYAYLYLTTHGLQGYYLLGGVFLAVTGGEALYADLGHFGKSPIRFCWFTIVLPCLLLNYFGQGAYLLNHPQSIANPFYNLAPKGLHFTLVIIATFATIIASQAVISATFSLTKQAILLGLCPRIPIVQTSERRSGEIYIPQINVILFLGTLLLTLYFKTSSNMTHAYGIAVNLDMLIVTCLVTYAARVIWRWSMLHIALIFSVFIVMDMLFLGANLHKFLTGGWLPVCFASFVAFLMFTWNRGLIYLKNNYYVSRDNIATLVNQLNIKEWNTFKGMTAVFIMDTYDSSGGSFLHFLKLLATMPENILIVNYSVHHTPKIRSKKRYEVITLGENVHQLILHYGFMDEISIPRDLAKINEYKLLPFEIEADLFTYLVEVPHILVSRKLRTLWFYWQKKFFVFLMRNYSTNMNIDFYQLPHNRTIAIGTYCVI